MIYIGSEHILSPLGTSAQQNFEAAVNGLSGITHSNKNDSKSPASVIADFDLLSNHTKIESLGITSAKASLEGVNKNAFQDKWLFILSTTKGDIDYLKSGEVEKAKPSFLANQINKELPIHADEMVVSNACISGLLAAITASDLIKVGKYDHVLILGADLVSEFTTRGFESFYALSNSPSAPFDENRTGLSLGEGVSSLVLSSSLEIFNESPVIFAGGASANDANHISGPSRDGEGLVRAIEKAFVYSETTASDIDFISAHGTGTRFNDDMESIAFNRCELGDTRMNSMKGYFGHTLGSAGAIELSMSIQSMRNSLLLKTLGCTNPGTTNEVNVLLENEHTPVNTILKTASGFGGCNAAAVLKQIK